MTSQIPTLMLIIVKHGMDAVEPSVYFESPSNRLNFVPLFERLLWKDIQQKR